MYIYISSRPLVDLGGYPVWEYGHGHIYTHIIYSYHISLPRLHLYNSFIMMYIYIYVNVYLPDVHSIVYMYVHIHIYIYVVKSGETGTCQWECQDTKMEVLCHIRRYFAGIFPYIGLIYGRYLQFRFLKWPLNLGTYRRDTIHSFLDLL